MVVAELEAAFDDGLRTQHSGFSHLNLIVLSVGFGCLGDEAGAAHAAHIAAVVVVVAQCQGIVLRQGKIDTRIDAPHPIRGSESGNGIHSAEGRIQNHGIDQSAFIDEAAAEFDLERGPPIQRAAHIAFQHFGGVIGAGGDERIARIQILVAEVEEAAAVKLVCARAGEDFHATEAGMIEFRRKRIGVHANLANGTLGRQLTAAETVDEELRAIGASRGTRQSLQVGLQIVGIIGQRVQIGAGHHNGSDIAGGIGRDRAGGLFIH